jgi:hypothetical protein
MVPILIAALIFASRGSQRAQLIWMGALDYMLYNYAFYVFAAAFNWFFLIYAALLGLSIFALIFGFVSINVNAIARRFRSRTPVRWISGYMVFSAIGLSVVYLVQSIAFIFTRQLPSIITRTGGTTSIIFALDLTLLIPVMILGATPAVAAPALGLCASGNINRQRACVQARVHCRLDIGSECWYTQCLN